MKQEEEIHKEEKKQMDSEADDAIVPTGLGLLEALAEQPPPFSVAKLTKASATRAELRQMEFDAVAVGAGMPEELPGDATAEHAVEPLEVDRPVASERQRVSAPTPSQGSRAIDAGEAASDPLATSGVIEETAAAQSAGRSPPDNYRRSPAPTLPSPEAAEDSAEIQQTLELRDAMEGRARLIQIQAYEDAGPPPPQPEWHETSGSRQSTDPDTWGMQDRAMYALPPPLDATEHGAPTLPAGSPRKRGVSIGRHASTNRPVPESMELAAAGSSTNSSQRPGILRWFCKATGMETRQRLRMERAMARYDNRVSTTRALREAKAMLPNSTMLMVPTTPPALFSRPEPTPAPSSQWPPPPPPQQTPYFARDNARIVAPDSPPDTS